jgi:hypothetical protein
MRQTVFQQQAHLLAAMAVRPVVTSVQTGPAAAALEARTGPDAKEGGLDIRVVLLQAEEAEEGVEAGLMASLQVRRQEAREEIITPGPEAAQAAQLAPTEARVRMAAAAEAPAQGLQ